MIHKTKAENENQTVQVANAIKTNYPWLYYSKIMVFALLAIAAAWLTIEN